MLKNKKFDSKIRKYKKIYIYPRNNNFKNEDKISIYKLKHTSKLKYNLSNLLEEKNNITENTKSFLKYYIPKTSSNHNIKAKNKLRSDYRFDSFQSKKNSKKILDIFNENQNSNIYDKYEEILEELRYIKQNNKSININININNDCHINRKKKSKSITCLSSKNKLYDYKITNDIILNEQEKNKIEKNNFNRIKALFKNNIIDIFNNNNIKENINNNIDLKSNIYNSKEYLSIENNNKIKNINKIDFNTKEKKKLNQKESYIKKPKKLEIIKSKINNINNIIKERCKSNPKKINISNIFDNNKSKGQYPKNISNTEEKNNKNYYIEINDEISNNNKYNLNTNNNSFKIEEYNIYNSNKKKMNENEENSFIIKERNLSKNNKVNISLFNEETDNQIQNWINKEKRNKEYKKENDKNKNKNFLFFDKINNKEFHKYQISNKYFNSNDIFIDKQINNKKPFKSINLGDFLNLELSKFNNRLNNNNYIQKSTNTINARHIFKPLY